MAGQLEETKLSAISGAADAAGNFAAFIDYHQYLGVSFEDIQTQG